MIKINVNKNESARIYNICKGYSVINFINKFLQLSLVKTRIILEKIILIHHILQFLD